MVNMCEIKFYNEIFSVDSDYYRKILSRQETIRNMVHKKMSVHSTIITTFGLDNNKYRGAFTNVITLDDLF